MVVTAGMGWLIDKSAYARLGASNQVADWISRIERGLVRVTVATVLEVGYSARSGQDWESLVTQPPLSSMPIENSTPAIESRAVEVQGILARLGQHRAPSIRDLLIAATAELAGLVILHCDKDFELIAGVTGQPLERLGLADGAD